MNTSVLLPRQKPSLPQLKAAKRILEYAYQHDDKRIHLHPNQRRILAGASRFNVVACGRQFGKTKLGEYLTIETLKQGLPVAYFSPTYKMMIEVWREIVLLLNDSIVRKSAQEKRIETRGGGTLDMWSLDNPDVARGRKYARAIVDEAAMVPDLMDAWQYVIRPTLLYMQGDAWFKSTPKGHNGFWRMYQWGIDNGMPEWVSWQMPTSANPYIAQSEINALRAGMPERTYKQEILAEFIEDAGGVFRRVAEAATASPIDTGVSGRQYVIGADWARSNDYTVFTVIDVQARELVYMDRFTQIDYNIQAGRLRSLYSRFPGPVIAEFNSMGGPIVERLQSEGVPVTGFVTTNATKERVIRGLESAFENGEIKILNDAVLIGELQAYEQERLASGWRFTAPAGMHDDCVMSLALAWSGANTGPLLVW